MRIARLVVIDPVRDLPRDSTCPTTNWNAQGGVIDGNLPYRQYRNEVPSLIVSLERSPLRRVCGTNEEYVAAARAAGEPCAHGVNCADDSESDRQQKEE